MAEQNQPWRRQGEDFWRAHHEAWMGWRNAPTVPASPLKAEMN